MSPYFEKLQEKLEYIYQLNSVESFLHWDEMVNLPEGAAEERTKQNKVIAELAHLQLTDGEIADYLEKLQELPADRLSLPQQTLIREVKRDLDRASKLPADFIAELKAKESECYHAWAKARKDIDFKSYAPKLKEMVDLKIREAEIVGHREAPYDYMIDLHDPGMTAARIKELFDELRGGLLPLIDKIMGSGITVDLSELKGFDLKKQKAFCEEVAGQLGFDFNRGRLDVSVHPFCGGNSGDVRMTTRFFEDNPLDSLFSTIHETGHALYEQGLPKATYGTPLSQAVGMGVHESQSRLWENQVGRSREFWKFWEPRYRELFGKELSGVDSERLYRMICSVTRNPIRVDSDEVMYNLHIILRFELERELIGGTLAVKDLPEAWNAKSEEILGLKPKNDKEGVLQDIHWSMGAFGYFPSYSIGNMIAAQLWDTAREKNPDLDNSITNGEFAPLLKWLREEIHQYGKQYRTEELVQKVTGKGISPQPLLGYLKARYLPLYQA